LISERAYRQRLDADLARWQADGVISSSAADAIRGKLPPVPEGVTITAVVAIVGGLLIAAAFLAFIAANWTAIARPIRFGILLAGIVAAYATAIGFDRKRHPIIADLAVTVGTIIFGSAIALTGQMYHLADDFAAGLLLWAGGALIAAVLTHSRGALAVALVAGCLWSGARMFETYDIHLPFIGFWLIAAVLAVVWNAVSARHLVAVAAIAWLVLFAIGADDADLSHPIFAFGSGASLLFGAGLALASRGADSPRAFGLTLSNYAAIALAVCLAASVVVVQQGSPRPFAWPIAASGGIGLLLALNAAVLAQRAGAVLAALSIALALVVMADVIRPETNDEPWLLYAMALASMLCLVISGMLDEVRPRVVAGWIGLAAVIAGITWAVKGSLLRRAVFLAAAGIAAVGLASVLGRLVRGERAQ
jgi:uncharacterized membrane protein